MSDYLPGNALNPDYLTAVALGNIPGACGVNISGRKDNVAVSVLDDISQIPGVTEIPDPGGIQLAFKSSNANDTIAGTGIQKIKLSYLDTNWNPFTEVVELAGVSLVNTVATDIGFVQTIYAVQVGSTGGAVGNISLVDTGDTLVFDYLTAGGNSSLTCRYTVPATKTAYIVGWDAGAITQKIDFRLRATVDHGDSVVVNNGIFLFKDITVIKNVSSGYNPFRIPIRLPATAQVKISGKGGSSGGDASASIELLLIDI